MNLPLFHSIVALSLATVFLLGVFGLNQQAYFVTKFLLSFFSGIAVSELVL